MSAPRVHVLALLAGLLDAADSCTGQESEPKVLVDRAASILDAAHERVRDETLTEAARALARIPSAEEGAPS